MTYALILLFFGLIPLTLLWSIWPWLVRRHAGSLSVIVILILLGVFIISAYALPLDALAVARGWGGLNPSYVSGVYFFGSLLLEEIIFWLGTSFVTISAVLIFAKLERRGVPWWALAAGVFLPLEVFDQKI
jgi:hypothetical protein